MRSATASELTLESRDISLTICNVDRLSTRHRRRLLEMTVGRDFPSVSLPLSLPAFHYSLPFLPPRFPPFSAPFPPFPSPLPLSHTLLPFLISTSHFLVPTLTLLLFEKMTSKFLLSPPQLFGCGGDRPHRRRLWHSQSTHHCLHFTTPHTHILDADDDDDDDDDS